MDLSVKRVPDEVAHRLRKRADANHRLNVRVFCELAWHGLFIRNLLRRPEAHELAGFAPQLMAILQEAVQPPRAHASTVRETAAPAYRARGSRVAPASESALIIRQAREGRTFSVADLHRYVSALGPGTPDESTRWIRQERSKR